MPIQCYKVSVRKVDDKCVITSQSLLSFFLYEAPKEALSKKILLFFIKIVLATVESIYVEHSTVHVSVLLVRLFDLLFFFSGAGFQREKQSHKSH